MTDTEYVIIMLAKLLAAIERKEKGVSQNFQGQDFLEEIREMAKAIYEHHAVQNHINSVEEDF